MQRKSCISLQLLANRRHSLLFASKNKYFNLLRCNLLALPTNFPGIQRLNDKTGNFSALQAFSRREYEWKMANGNFTFVLNKFHQPTFIHPMLQNVGQRAKK